MDGFIKRYASPTPILAEQKETLEKAMALARDHSFKRSTMKNLVGRSTSGVEGPSGFSWKRAIVEVLSKRATGKEDTSGIGPVSVVGLVGGFVVAFAFLCLIGLILRYTNRPTTQNGIGVGYSGGLYQPSASGYKSARAAAIAAADGSAPLQGVRAGGGATVGGNESRANLLENSSPMGYGGNDYPPNDQGSSSVPGPGGRMAGTHGRAPSSGLGFPGPPAAARRGFGGQQSHPGQQGGFSSAGPDGGGFRPGQVVGGGGGFSGGGGRPMGPGGLGSPPANGPGAAPANHLRYPRGPPPASDATRRSRYSRAGGPGVNQADRRSRIDSVGPGTYRKSMYLPPDGSSPPHLPTVYNSNATQGYPPSARNGSGNSNGSQGYPPSARNGSGNNSGYPPSARNGSGNSSGGGGGGSGGLRRVESIGKGTIGRGNSINRHGVGQAPDQKMMLGAQSDNFGGGSGRRSPNQSAQQPPVQMNGQRRPSGSSSSGNGGGNDPLGARNGPNQQQQRPMNNNRGPPQQGIRGPGPSQGQGQMGRGPNYQPMGSGMGGGMAPGQIFRPPQQQRVLLG